MYTEKNWKSIVILWFLLSVISNIFVKGENSSPCGGTLTATRGVLQTPGFPNEFRVPILCKWVIDATEIASVNTSIVVYLTQLFVFEGLSFEEYETYDKRYNILGKRIHTVLENNVSKVKWVRTQQNVLVVTFQLQSIENSHLRILDYFLDVYGFNITYEITTEPIRRNTCTMSECGFTGICYDDFTEFYCQCFPGYSGPTCSSGPNSLCTSEGVQLCQNDSICRHVGTTTVKCDCMEGYIGERCQKRINFASKYACSDRNSRNNCNCSKEISSVTDGAELSTTLRLMQGPSLKKEDLQLLLQNQIAGHKLGVSQADRVRVSDLNYYEWGTEATIHFYGLKKDKKRVEALISRWIHAGHIGNLTLIDRNISLRNDSRLFIKSISINQLGLIREGDQFILSCVVQGTPSTSFRWIKDGLPINVSQFASNKWFRLIQDPQIKIQYTALLGIDKASYLDEGIFVCEAADFEIRQCLSKLVEIRRPPSVKIEPMSLTVQKGENFTIKCICLSNKNDRFSYSWTKNKELLPIKTEMERYEILFPGGSILQVSRIDKPATYSCLVQDEVTSTEVSIQVDVIDRTVVHTCRGEKHMNILWPETAPGTQSIQECPKGFTGAVRRWCVLHDSENSLWQLPDFSQCTADPLLQVDTNFQRFHLGYEQGNVLEVLGNYQKYLKNRAVLLPGEGTRILNLVSNVISYINSSNEFSLIYNMTNAVFDIIDNVMKHSNSLINQMQVTLLQQTVRNQIHFSEEIIKAVPVYHHTFTSIDVSIAAYKPNSILRIPFMKNKYPLWYGYTLEASPYGQHETTYLNESVMLSCIVYKNLSAFLPARSAIRMRDGTEMEYEIISNVVAVWLLKHDKLFIDNTFSFVMEFSHSVINTTMSKWSINCSLAVYASYGYNWDITGCFTELINSTATKCVCAKPGSYALLVTTVPLTIIKEEYSSYQTLVLIGCSFCLFFSILTEFILIAHWIIQKSSLAFLKVQYCFVLASAMAIFVIALSNEIPNDSYSYINTFLEIFFLIALSSHISKCLIVFTEFVELSKAPNLSKTVVAISTGVPVITVFASHLTHRTIGKRQPSWWLINGSVSFNIFITAFLIMIFLYNIMYLIVMEKLTQCSDKQNKNSSSIVERKKLLKRSFYIFWSTVTMICSSVMYINMKASEIWNYSFALSNVLLVTVFFTCYIFKPETTLMEQVIERLKINSSKKYTAPKVERHDLDSKNESDFEKKTTSNKNSNEHRSLGHSKSTNLILSDLQNIPTHTRNLSTETHTMDNTESVINKETTGRQCGKFQDLKDCMNTQRHLKVSPYACNKRKQQEYRKSEVQEYLYSPDVVATRVHVELDLVTPIIHDSNCDHTKNLTDDKPIILCNIAVNSRCEINQKPFLPYSSETDEKVNTENLENVSKANVKCERFQLSGLEALLVDEHIKSNSGNKSTENCKSTQPVAHKSVDSLDGMLDKISHDLDYLLNRKKSLTPSTTAAEEEGQNEEEEKKVRNCSDQDDDYQKRVHTHTF